MRDLKGKVAVITGGASGIGLATGTALCRAGMHVVLADVNGDAARTAASRLGGPDARVVAVQTDVSSTESMTALAAMAFDAFGEVHVLVNNAGVAPFAAFEDMSDLDWQWIWSINVQGVVNGVSAFLPRWHDQAGEKHIVNTSSMAGLVTLPNLSAYAATKAAVVSISETLRVELAAQQIGVSVLCPGLVRTSLSDTTEQMRPGTRQTAVQFADAMTRFIDPSEVGAKVRDAIEDNAAYIFTHPEWEPLAARRFAEMLSAFGNTHATTTDLPASTPRLPESRPDM